MFSTQAQRLKVTRLLLTVDEATKLIQFENKYMRNDIGKAIDEA